jgi:hypothetical protein
VREDYAELQAAVERAGFFTSFQPIREPDDRIVCASHEHTSGARKGNLSANSFWVAKRSGNWFVATWGPRYYRVAEPARLVELCIRLLSREPRQAYAAFNEATQGEFGLIEIDETEFPD